MTHLLTRSGALTASPYAFGIVAVYAIVWVSVGHIDFHGAATLATWIMTLFIQRAEHRDTQAIHAKLDELLRSRGEARTELARLDEKEPEDIERFRAAEKKRDASG